jgi:radical SAM-linked protein
VAADVHRLRVEFCKLGDNRFISHLDLCTTLNRALRRADLPVAYTEGFSPRPRTAFGPPLPLFVEGERELADFELAQPVEPADVVARMNAVLPEGIRLASGVWVPPRTPSITAAIREASYRVTAREGSWEPDAAGVAALLARDSIVIQKESKGAKREVDIRPAILSLSAGGGLTAQLAASPSLTLNVFDLLRALDPPLDPGRLRVVRTGFVLDPVPPVPAP